MPSLTWIGKEAVQQLHRQIPYRLLRCDDALSVAATGDGNLLVEGDNLHALKALLPYYAGKVKCSTLTRRTTRATKDGCTTTRSTRRR